MVGDERLVKGAAGRELATRVRPQLRVALAVGSVLGVVGLALFGCSANGTDDGTGGGPGRGGANTGGVGNGGGGGTGAGGGGVGGGGIGGTGVGGGIGGGGAGGGSLIDTGVPDGQTEGCAKVDFLFVIDNSGSMGAHQDNLIKSFPGFIQTIQKTLQGQDYHIMIVDGDAEDICDDICAGSAPSCGLAGESCASLGVATGCDATLGAGRVFDIHKKPCGPLDGGRFMTQNQPSLAAAFQCVARVGSYGQGNERPMGAMLQAVADSGPAKTCNGDFLRKDAPLVVTVLTDAPPQTASEQVNGQPKDWFDGLVAAKSGNEKSITVIGLVSDGDLPGGLCSTEVGDARFGSPKLREWVKLFTHNVLGSVCEPDYTQFFASAVHVVDATCREFVPPK